MASDRYMKELRKVMQDTSPAKPTALTPAEIINAIAGISDQLRGNLSNVERLCLIEERAELRKQLAESTP